MIYSFFIIIFVLIFLGPYAILLSHFSLSFKTSLAELLIVLQNTFLQATGSGLLSVGLGILGGLGLLWLGRVTSTRLYFWIEKIILLPNLLPSLFVILSCLGVIRPFPFGIVGVIVIHSLVNIGLVAILFKTLCLQKLRPLAQLSLIEGASTWQFFRVGVLGYLKMDIIYLFLFVFSISLISFNVPYMIGGPSGATLEVLIFEKLVIHHSWSDALGLSFIQMALIGIVSFLSHQTNWNEGTSFEDTACELLEWKWGLIFPILAVVIILFSPLQSLSNGIKQLEFLNVSLTELINPIYNSFQIGLGGGILIFGLSLLACYGFSSKWVRGLSQYFLSPGPVLLGFAFFLIQPYLNKYNLLNSLSLQIMIGLSILYFWTLYRLALASALKNLNRQIEVAQVLGASPWMIFSQIIFPQVIYPITFLCGLGSMWICGDFAFSRVISSSDFHLALIIKSLASSYRLDAAQVLVLMLYVISLGLFIFWWRLGHVLNRKFNIQAR